MRSWKRPPERQASAFFHRRLKYRELYARSKRILVQQDWKYTQNYADAKTPVIEEILLRISACGDVVGE
jgi:GrpB-like predicted nucleotidyltransferase (UPF0157 family)